MVFDFYLVCGAAVAFTVVSAAFNAAGYTVYGVAACLFIVHEMTLLVLSFALMR